MSVYNQYWKEIIEKWDSLPQIDKDYTIQEELIPYYMVWDKLSPSQKEFVCKRKDLDYEKYWNFIDNNQKCYVYQNNENFDFHKYWDTMKNSQILDAIEHNNKLDYESLWDKMLNIHRTKLIECRDDFNYEKYWDRLDNEQIRAVVMKHWETIDIDKYWEYFSEEIIRMLITTERIDFNKDIDKLNKCIEVTIDHPIWLESLLHSSFNEKPKKEKTRKIGNHRIIELTINTYDNLAIYIDSLFKSLMNIDIKDIEEVKKYNETILFYLI